MLVSHWARRKNTMPIANYTQNPALRPTVLVHEVLKNVYRPSELPPARPDATDSNVARETSRAA
jgi:hypothetical protein